MSREAVLNNIYFKKRLIRNFDFDALQHAPLNCYITEKEVADIRYLVTSAKYSGTPKNTKLKMIDDILRPKGFTRVTTGTNRAIYKFEYDQSFMLKIAMDDVGIRDSPAEMFNQEILKPFVPKVFDVSPCGTVEMIERVDPINNRHEFSLVAAEIFDILENFFLGKYVLEDIGTDFFKNWGIRDGFGPVLLDFPYLYEIDGDRLKCTRTFPDGTHCHGFIDYDNGLNTLVCEECGQRYAAKDLGANNGAITIKTNKKKEDIIMIEQFKVSTVIGGVKRDLTEGTDFASPRYNRRKKNRSSDIDNLKVSVVIPKAESKKEKPLDYEAIPGQEVKYENAAHAQEAPAVTPEIKRDSAPAMEMTSREVSLSTEPGKTEEIATDTIAEAVPEQQTSSAKELMLIEDFLVESVRGFDFEANGGVANQSQRNDLINFLFTATLSKHLDIDAEKAISIVTEFVDNNYTFNEDDKIYRRYESEIAQYEDEESIVKIGKRRNVRNEL